jgi:hypothetical protein
MGVVSGGLVVRYRGRKKSGRVVKLKVKGKPKYIRLHKGLPKGCKTAKRICIKCLVTPIHKLDKNYDIKICKQCEGGC